MQREKHEVFFEQTSGGGVSRYPTRGAIVLKMTDISEIHVERLETYSERDALGIGRLLPFLSDKFPGDAVPKELLEEIINSPFHEQLVAKIEAQIVGSATLSIVMGVGAGKKAWLEDFVTDENVRGLGVGDKVWQEMISWCEENDIPLLEFTSRPERLEARSFYEKHEAKLRDTSVFVRTI